MRPEPAEAPPAVPRQAGLAPPPGASPRRVAPRGRCSGSQSPGAAARRKRQPELAQRHAPALPARHWPVPASILARSSFACRTFWSSLPAKSGRLRRPAEFCPSAFVLSGGFGFSILAGQFLAQRRQQRFLALLRLLPAHQRLGHIEEGLLGLGFRLNLRNHLPVVVGGSK